VTSGDCALVKVGDTEVLIDAGSKRDSAITLVPYIKQYCTDGILEYVIATHAHEDHIAAFVGYNGTDGIFFVTAPPEMGFYLKERTFQPQIAKEAMEQGYVVVCVQRKGYWTRGGHYLLLEEMFEDGTIQVRDSNIFNYGRLEKHREDRFPWTTVPPSACGYWIFENKITAIPACSRCGDPQGTCDSMVQGDYTCEKCIAALRRRSTFLALTGEEMGTVIPQ
jgi:hypothetical protein